MKKSLFGTLSLALCFTLWAPATVFAQESGTVVEDNSDALHGTILRGTAERTDPSKMGENSEEATLCVERRKAKHNVDGPHAWVPPLPGGEITVPDDLIVPNGPPSQAASAETRGTNPLTLYTNTDITGASGIPLYNLSNVTEPTVVMSGNQVLYTANWVAAASTDGGATFTHVSPFPGPFANPAGQTFCCDQTTAYDPGTDTSFWLQLFINGGASPSAGTQRINVDQNSDGVWDCHYDITAQTMGWGTNRWPDFPDLAVSSNYLWHSSNVFTNASVFDNAFAARYPLSELAACAPTLNFNSRTASYFSLRFARGMTTTGYYAAHHSQTSLRTWTWADASPIPIQRTVATAAWVTGSQGSWSCPGPDSRNWCARMDSRIQSGYVADGVIGFMWMPKQAGTFTYPYTRVARYSEADWSHIDDVDIWSPDMAWVYPAVAVNSQGGLGGTIMWGGGTYANNCSVFIADAENGGALTPLEHEVSIAGNYGSTEGGDYTMVRVASPDDTKFVGACFANKYTSRANPMFVYFGRDVTLEPHIFSDGFETGSTSAWNN